jgi:hypothetical protein
MNNPRQHDHGLLRCVFVADVAETLVALAAGLLASACAIAPAAVEAELWKTRRTVAKAITSWREVISGFNDEGGAR